MFLQIFILSIFLGLSASAPERLYTPPSLGSAKSPSRVTPTTLKPGSKSSGAVTPSPVIGTGTSNPFNLTFVVSVKDLPPKKKGAKGPNAYVKVFHRTGTIKESPDWTPIDQSETVKENFSPTFLKVFSFVWTKGKNQQLHFEVKGHHSISKDEGLGQADVVVDEYVLQKGQDMTVKLSDGGTINIKKVEPISFRLYARMVPKMDPFSGASDPFVECYWRFGKNGTDTKFYTTKVVKDSENPDWNETIEFQNYQLGTDMFFNFKVFDEDSMGKNDVIGEVLVEVDPFVQKRAAKVNQLSKDPKNKATLTITPA